MMAKPSWKSSSEASLTNTLIDPPQGRCCNTEELKMSGTDDEQDLMADAWAAALEEQVTAEAKPAPWRS